MRRGRSDREPGVRSLDAAGPALAAGVPASPSGAIHLRSAMGGIVPRPSICRTIVFGRAEPDVHVTVGVGDRCASREQGRVTQDRDRWVIANCGRRCGYPARCTCRRVTPHRWPPAVRRSSSYANGPAHARPLSWDQTAEDLVTITRDTRLITELLLSTTLVPPDLIELDWVER